MITLFDRAGLHYSLREHYVRSGRQQSLNKYFENGFCCASPKRCSDMRHPSGGCSST
ncbi:hypothetical protein CY34DRAFT_807127 [Suillus luteus UH-Slu-Lm8-n1]|uniref:Uncharacterized protein n=1 Tax=Suillus luteus UH-Slu-Lm8-n1 TaxID=930992 RepID=A0A0D0AFM7_9AGAM|nr:hypothetical protein CY34DRAFT_807127 [Suillus luteus UH-Slu-Lm8-n1]